MQTSKDRGSAQASGSAVNTSVPRGRTASPLPHQEGGGAHMPWSGAAPGDAVPVSLAGVLPTTRVTKEVHSAAHWLLQGPPWGWGHD